MLKELQERVKAATGPDRELDAAICAQFRWYGLRTGINAVPKFWETWAGEVVAVGSRVVLKRDNGEEAAWTQAEKVTSSIDAALALVERLLPGWAETILRHALVIVAVERKDEPFLKALALAIVSAMLAVLAAEHKD